MPSALEYPHIACVAAGLLLLCKSGIPVISTPSDSPEVSLRAANTPAESDGCHVYSALNGARAAATAVPDDRLQHVHLLSQHKNCLAHKKRQGQRFWWSDRLSFRTAQTTLVTTKLKGC